MKSTLSPSAKAISQRKSDRHVISLLLLLGLAVSAQGASSFPEIIPLPNGWGPEGIAVGRGTEFYAGARQNSPFQGAIYKGDLRTGVGGILVPPLPGRYALGLSLDKRSNHLFVAGSLGGGGYVYDGTTGADVAVFQFAAAPPTFVNDVVVIRTAAYFTDSFRPVLYRVPLLAHGALPSPPVFQEIPLSGDFQFVPGPFVFNANGIAATADGDWLIVVHSTLGLLYRVDPHSGAAVEIDLAGDSVTRGDGLLLDGHTLYVCRNANNVLAVVELDPDFLAGVYVGDLVSPAFDFPTTIAEFGQALYAVNARFATPLIPGITEYQIVRVSK